jgi:hypothetical protein
MPQRVFASLKHRMIEHYQHLHGEIQCHSDWGMFLQHLISIDAKVVVLLLNVWV